MHAPLERRWRLAWRRLGVLNHPSADLVPWRWELLERLAAAPSRRGLRHWCEHLEDAAERGGVCTWGMPWAPEETNRRWLGPRLVFWPRGLPSQPLLGVASSRLGRDLSRRASWFAALRTAARHAASRRWTLTTSARSATWPWVPRAAWWFAGEALTLHVSSRESWSAWLEALAREAADANEAWVSPCLAPATDLALAEHPLRDRLLLGLCPQVVVLHERAGGSVAALTEQRLREATWPSGSLQRLQGAAPPFSPWPAAVAAETGPGVGDLKLDEPFLWHWTRARRGPWPGQSPQEYVDQLLWSGCGAPRDAFAALRRILGHRRLTAQAGGYRGGGAAVSFTATPLGDWESLRVYRRHRGRWDFTPYGIGLRRAWLERRGARPVIYGDEAVWRRLPPERRPFFQLARSRGQSQTDWTSEREWRVPGDVDFSTAAAEDCVVFVRTPGEAALVRQASPWPVVSFRGTRESSDEWSGG